MIEIAPAAVNRKDHILVQGTLKAELPLAAFASHVRVGTPLRPSPGGGWVPAYDGTGEMIAGEAKYGNEMVVAYRAVVLKTPNQDKLPVGKLSIADVDDTGFVVFKSDPTGPFLRLARNLVLMDMSIVAILATLREAPNGV